MEDKLHEGICWVKIQYPDPSVRIFRGTMNLDICRDRGFSNLGFREILDMGKSTIIYVPPEAVLSVHDTMPEYERGVDKFASRFI